MVTRMHIFRKGAWLRWAAAFVVTVSAVLLALVQGGQASTTHQTIPTAPPATATAPAIAASATPTKPPQSTGLATQTIPAATQTAGGTVNPTTGDLPSRPSSTPSTTAGSGNGTIPIIAGTHTPAGEGMATPAQAATGTATAAPATTGPRWSGYCLL